MRPNRIKRAWLVLLVLCFALQGNASLAEENPTKTTGQSGNPLFEEFTEEESHGFMHNFLLKDALATGRAAIWFGTNAAQVLPTAIVPNRQAPRVLKSATMLQKGSVTTITSLGELSLDQFLLHPKSFAEGFIVVRKGRIVFEKYPRMTEADAHVTSSAAKVFALLLIDLLIEEGKTDEQKALGDYVPEFVGTVWTPIKVIDVIERTTGLDPIDGPEHFANLDTVTARILS